MHIQTENLNRKSEEKKIDTREASRYNVLSEANLIVKSKLKNREL